MKKILIAESSSAITVALVDALKDRYMIHICTDSNTALERLEDLRPDALIINLGLDGLTILEDASYAPQVILALTDFVSNEVIRQAAALGVNYIFVIPCSINSVVAQLDNLLGRSVV